MRRFSRVVLNSVALSAVAVFGLAVLMFPQSAGAATCADPAGDGSVASITGSVTTNAGCQLGSTINDTLVPLQVNLDTMFGFNDWVFDAKDNDINGVDEGANSLGLSLTGGTLSGTWSIGANAFSIFTNIMLVFADGNGIPDVYVGYLLNSTSGTYDTPFWNPTAMGGNGDFKDISHVSIYGRGSPPSFPPPIPLPAALPLFGTGLGILGFLGWRRRCKAQAV